MISYQTLTSEVRLNRQLIKKVVAFVHRITDDGEWYFSRSDVGKITAFPDRAAWNSRRTQMISNGWQVCDYVDMT